MPPLPPPPEVGAPTALRLGKWEELGERLQQRLITAIDLLSILISDAVILTAGYFLLALVSWATSKPLKDGEAAFFEMAHGISAGLFLLLYVVLVAFHVQEFVSGQLYEKGHPK